MEPLVTRYLEHIHGKCTGVHSGQVADYIPELATVDPSLFGISLVMHDGQRYSAGDAQQEFTIQSISKPFTYALGLAKRGVDVVDAAMGVEPSGEPFNEISLDSRGKPKNPMINAGAIVATSLICDTSCPSADTFGELLDCYSAFAGRRLSVDEKVFASEQRTGARNRSIAYMLQATGALDADVETTLELYFRQCSIKVTSDDLAIMAATLANGGLNPRTGRRVVSEDVVQRVLSVMVTCGMYDGAGTWVSDVGMPAKSGVGGGILAVLPGQVGIGCFSPPLDEHGNSSRGVAGCKSLSADLGLHMFHARREGQLTVRSSYRLPGVEEGVTRQTASPAERALRQVRDRTKIYELQGDLNYAGAEAAMRAIERDAATVSVVIVDMSRVDDVDRVGLAMFTTAQKLLADEARLVIFVDPDKKLEKVTGESPIPVDISRTHPQHVVGNLGGAVSLAEELSVRSRLAAR